MNALMGDPTTEKLLPLIDAAADVGRRDFCIDAGWYDDDGDWWPSVGAWEPSTVRFGELGLPGLLQVIRDRGMTPGLWVEPEVVGVRSPVASDAAGGGVHAPRRRADRRARPVLPRPAQRGRPRRTSTPCSTG